MNAVNYDKKMQEIIKSEGERKPSLLLHACCAPCSSACLERLKDHFDVTVFFYNPNIENDEYEKRRRELMRFIAETGWAKALECEHDTSAFYQIARGLESAAEGGERCRACFALRLKRTAERAAELGFEYFCTTLTLSPLKDSALLNEIGEKLSANYGVKWLYSDFKKRDGYLESLRLSKQYSLYRQNYCGCVYSQSNA